MHGDGISRAVGGLRRVLGSVCLCACVVALTACVGGNQPEIAGTRAGLACVDDSFECISQRKATLQAMVGDNARKWITEPATPSAYASGVRLFAFKSKKKDLSCDELARGHKEAEAGPLALKTTGTGLTPAQVSRGTMLAHDVGRELQTEYNRRCKKS